MHNDDLCYVSATEALALFKAKKLSPRELMTAIIDRAERVNPAINCFADRYFEEALEQARAAEKIYMSDDVKPGVLEGIPLAVKDAQRVAGRRTTHGSLIFKDNVDDHSDPMIARLQKAGAIVFARTTTPEFCLSGVTHSRIWGVTRNPWNTDWGPGGSSGGSGAALAAGLALSAPAAAQSLSDCDWRASAWLVANTATIAQARAIQGLFDDGRARRDMSGLRSEGRKDNEGWRPSATRLPHSDSVYSLRRLAVVANS